jgi:hypothetical protein
VTVTVELYCTDDYVSVGRVDIAPLLQLAFRDVLGGRVDDVEFHLAFHALPDERPLEGHPVVVNLRASHGFVHVRIVRDRTVLYQHSHPVREIVGRPLQSLLRAQAPDQRHWGFGIVGPGLERARFARPVPQAPGTIRLPGGRRRPRAFHLREVAEAAPAVLALADLGATAEPDPAVTPVVVLDGAVRDGMVRDAPFSDEVEEGGFLIGRVFRDVDRPERFVAHVTEALPGERTGASLWRFTFSGESFLRINHLVDQRAAGERLVGWYHTHLFAASDDLGLSGTDVELHRTIFRRPWQIAGLVNIADGRRTLRFYAAAPDRTQQDGVTQVPYQVVAG